MNKYIAIEDIQPVLLKEILIPSITMWNRLEGRPRTDNFDRALKAEVRDALFMLTKQWQMGEFQGDDAGSPIFAKVHMETTQITRYRAASNPMQAFQNDVPLETKVEQRAFPLLLDMRLAMGRHWLKLLKTPELSPLKGGFIKAFPITAPDPLSRADASIAAHQQNWQTFSAAAGRTMDGGALYTHLKENTVNRPYDALTPAVPLTAAQKTALNALGEKFVAWFEKLFYQPTDPKNNAWLPERLEYQFACSAPIKDSQKVLEAEEYYHGHLDWYNFSISPNGALEEARNEPANVEGAITTSFFPVLIQFDGMPNTRWWTFEEGKTNFGNINPDTTDLNKLMLMEFGLIYANDWFLVPFTLPAGSLAKVRGMAVTNVFGERTWIQAAGTGNDEDWQRWSMFALDTKGSDAVTADTSLLLLPTNPKIQESKPLEEACLVRDEMANMVWAIETQVPLASGEAKSGREAALELHNHYKRIIAGEGPAPVVPTIENNATIRYQLLNSVPENWIPFIPVHVPGSNRQVQLQRASMPRLIEGDTQPIQKVKPRTDLLRHGLDVGQSYFLHEEEVPRAGICVSQSYQRTRWTNGRVYNWYGTRKRTGRGEASSGLAFDQILPIKAKKEST
ncbi:hypothetical protein [Nitrosomonas sp. Nm166]|uniref:hypothetical protein n=1 Tax=Nitrosomonas sp. Nm166 TaxID=1881054 RepID=UPI0008E1580F|nr:hypothetical protein [Nitrosomonas sp. Nm166]SFF10878.1 hypothetical protein SAMN05428977_10516 [Nitrosomonas sp. Nm166]